MTSALRPPYTPLEVLTVAEMTAADRAAVASGTPGADLMERAGGAVAEALMDRLAPGPVTVLCGPGSNGGDGFVVARRLRAAGWPVLVASAASAWRGDAGEAAASWDGPVRPLGEDVLTEARAVVDALYGAGLSRPVEGVERQTLSHVEERGLPIFAVDLPSGVSGDLARPLGYAPRAVLTVTFHRKKPAHLLYPARALCGEVHVCDIGLAPPERPLLFENGPGLWARAYPWPDPEGYKGRRGHLMVVSGPPTQTGAARLACRGGLRAGAGLVTLLAPPAAVLVNAVHLEAVMLRPFASTQALLEASEEANCVVIGPAAGVGEALREMVLALKGAGRRLVVDADALTSFKAEPEALFAVLDPADVLTPHAGEFERLFPGLLSAAPERISAVREAAWRSGATVLLKGPDTAVADPNGRCAVNVNASPFLATAGSGDVLAGIIGALGAQGLPGFEAACAGAYLHGAAGSALGPGLIAEDLPGALPQVLNHLYAQRVLR